MSNSFNKENVPACRAGHPTWTERAQSVGRRVLGWFSKRGRKTPADSKRVQSAQEFREHMAALVVEGLRRSNEHFAKVKAEEQRQACVLPVIDEVMLDQFEASARQRRALGVVVHEPGQAGTTRDGSR